MLPIHCKNEVIKPLPVKHIFLIKIAPHVLVSNQGKKQLHPLPFQDHADALKKVKLGFCFGCHIGLDQTEGWCYGGNPTANNKIKSWIM